jgi:hypothetical protein
MRHTSNQGKPSEESYKTDSTAKPQSFWLAAWLMRIKATDLGRE